MAVEIAGIQLHRVHRITSVEQAAFVYHRVPGLEGDLVQDMGRACVRLQIEGIFYGPTAADDMEALRKVSKERKPVDFLAEIVGQAYFGQVTLDQLELVQAAREPDQFSFALLVVEYVPPPQPAAPIDLSDVDAGLLAEAQSFMDAATLPDTLSLPSFTDPTAPIGSLLTGVEDAMAPAGGVADALSGLFGTGDSPAAAAAGSTLFDQISSGLGDSDLPDRLQSQVGQLSSIGQAATGLFEHPPAALDDLAQGVAGVALPATDQLGALPQVIGSLQSLVPSDLSGVTGGMLAGIGALSGQANGEIVERITGFVRSIHALHDLLQMLTSGSATPEGVEPSSMAAPARAAIARGRAPASATSPVPSSVAAATRQAVAATAAGQVQRVLAALDRLPDPLNVESLLEAMSIVLNGLKRGLFPVARLPLADELGQALGTLLQWRSMTGDQIAGQLESTLGTTAELVRRGVARETQAVVDRIDGIESALAPPALHTICQGLHLGLQTLAGAVATANLAVVHDTVAELDGLRTQLDGALAAATSGVFAGQSEDLLDRLAQLRARADGCMCDLLTALHPATDTGLVAEVSARATAAFRSAEVERFVDGYREMFGWLRELLDQIDPSIIQEPIATAAGAMQDAVRELDDLLVGAVTQTKLLFADVEKAIDQVDTAAIAAAIQDAIADFQHQVEAKIDELFAPVREALSAGIGEAVSAVEQFDPEDIVEALRQATQTLTGILSDPAILAAVQGIRDAADAMGEQLGSISFKPANDVVIGQIEEIETALAALDTSLLNNALKLALTAALAILPGEEALQDVKNQLMARIDELLASGPATLVAQVKLQPDRLLDVVRSYSPLVLLGDALSRPFQELLATLQGLKPSSLLQPVQTALAQLRSTLEHSANPGQLIAPLEQPFAQLLGLFDQLRPQALVAPLNDAIGEVIDTVLDALPVDELFDVFDTVLGHLQMITDTVGAVRALFHRASSLLDGFADAEGQMTAWIDSIIDRLDQVSDDASLGAAFDQLRAAIAALRAEDVTGRVVQRLEPFANALRELAPQARLTELVRDCRDFPHAAVAGLPAAERQLVEAFFAAFDPLAESRSRPMSQLQSLSDRLELVPAAIAETFVDWDATYLGPASQLATFVPADTRMPAVKALLRATIRDEVGQPLGAIFALLPNLGTLVTSFLAVFDELVQSIDDSLGALVDGPASLTTIRQTMDDLVSRIRGLNFDFLAEQLESVFDHVKGKLEALSPTELRKIVETAFSSALSKLDLGALLPGEDVESLDDAFAGLVTDLGELDPKKLVVDVVQPEFEAAIEPFLEPFDLTAQLTVVVEQLERLKGDLGSELDRTIAAFESMLDAVPSLEIDISLDVGGLF